MTIDGRALFLMVLKRSEMASSFSDCAKKYSEDRVAAAAAVVVVSSFVLVFIRSKPIAA